MLRRQLPSAILMVLAMTLLLGFAYPLAMTAVAQIAFKDKANGSLLDRDGQPVGSALLGQAFTGERYFQPRPSAAGDGYDPKASSATNLGPTNEALVADCYPVPTTDADGNDITDDQGNTVNETNPDGTPVCDPDTVPQRAKSYRERNGLAADAPVPADAVTASASGLDPAISIDNARLQADRVATERNLPPDTVRQLIDEHTAGRQLGVLGEPTVNVLELNLALDQTTR
jgi:K+-transporting ATPase ATPase C chain